MVPTPALRSRNLDNITDEVAKPVILLVEPQVFASESITNAMQSELEQHDIVQSSDGATLDNRVWDNLKLLIITSSGMATLVENPAFFERFTDRAPPIPVVFLGDPVDADTMMILSQLRPKGIFPALAQTNTVIAGIKFILEGGEYLPIKFNSLMNLVSNDDVHDIESKGASLEIEEALEPPSGALTNREKAVLGLLAQGESNKIIANQLGIAQNTAKIHVRGILRKLNVTNRTQAVLTAQRLNLLNLR